MKVKNNIENPYCSYFQNGRCVRDCVRFKDFKILVHGRCIVKPRDKCPNFKPREVDIYNFIKKNKNRLLKQEK